MEIEYQKISKFSKEFKKLAKKYKSLNKDFDKLKKYSIELFHDSKINFDNKGIFQIPGFNHNQTNTYKVKKFACHSLKGGAMSGLRVIYAHHHQAHKIVFLEIYYKGKKSIEDKQRIKEYLSQI